MTREHLQTSEQKCFYIKSTVNEQIKAICDGSGISESEFIRKAIEFFLRQNDQVIVDVLQGPLKEKIKKSRQPK